MTYREGADGGRGELGEVELLLLDLLADGEGALAVEHLRGDSGNALANGVIGGGLEVATLRDGRLVRLESSGDLRILRTREGSSDDGNFLRLLKSEGKPVLLLRSELLLGSEGDGGVEEGRGGGDDDAVLIDAAKSFFQTLRPETRPRKRTKLVGLTAATTSSSWPGARSRSMWRAATGSLAT